ncbi:hypothetical protein RJ639_034174 [Escallonia herrerae]|uniref:UTP25 NTP hydrolase-like domain-containing protein n=1 Tax=Escallonia herrerae TaxID=1293975 RepID=A0AA88WSU0_9ASTE|nr:hypothetical protein RJ639_034174 [Escallonia herrerae]
MAKRRFARKQGDSSEEHSDVASKEEAEEVVFKEPSMYDNLLKTLGSARESLANAYKKRQREEEGKSDSDESVDNDLKSLSASDEEDDGSDYESPNANEGSTIQGSELVGASEESQDNGTDHEGASDTDEEHDLAVNGQSVATASPSTSSFYDHLGHILSKEEVESLLKRKWKYKWEAATVHLLNSKWTGTGECFLEDADMDSGYGIKLKLHNHWLDMYKASGGSDFHSSRQRMFFSLSAVGAIVKLLVLLADGPPGFLGNSYCDILHHNKKPFYLKGREEDSSIMDAYIVHSLNHIFKTSDLVRKNDAKVAKQREGAEEELVNGDGSLDHGFTRPKVLILLPLASIAFRVVKRLIQLTPSTHKVFLVSVSVYCGIKACYMDPAAKSGQSSTNIFVLTSIFCPFPGPSEILLSLIEENHTLIFIHMSVLNRFEQVNVEHIDRFYDDFGAAEIEDPENEGENENSKAHKSSKPSDFQSLFGGNNNDHFMIGIKFTRRSIKLYSDFYSSDIIVASPLGLTTKIGHAEVEKEKDVDYLSSIEVLIIDHADVIAMQNWSHVNSVVEKLNCLPTKQHGTDIMRIRH